MLSPLAPCNQPVDPDPLEIGGLNATRTVQILQNIQPVKKVSRYGPIGRLAADPPLVSIVGKFVGLAIGEPYLGQAILDVIVISCDLPLIIFLDQVAISVVFEMSEILSGLGDVDRDLAPGRLTADVGGDGQCARRRRVTGVARGWLLVETSL